MNRYFNATAKYCKLQKASSPALTPQIMSLTDLRTAHESSNSPPNLPNFISSLHIFKYFIRNFAFKGYSKAPDHLNPMRV